MVVNRLGEAMSLNGEVDSAFKLGPIELVGIQPTLFCNLNCSYCFLPTEERRTTKKIAMETVDKIGQRLFESGLVNGTFTVTWAASEPLSMGVAFYEEAFATLEKYNHSKTKIVHSFTTNATLLTEEWCEFFVRHEIYLAVSIDGPAFLHDRHRVTRDGKGTHAKVLRGLRLLRQYKVPFATISVLSNESLDYPDELYDFYRSEGIQGASLNYDEADGVNPNSSMNRSDNIERYERFLNRFYDIVKEDGSVLWVREFDGGKALFSPQELDKLRKSPRDYIAPNNQFVIPFAVLNIDCEGRFTTFTPEIMRAKHHKFGDFYLGNVFDDAIESTVHTAKFKEIWRDIAAGVQNCESTCPQFAFCGGGSPSNKYIENGSCASTETLHCRLTTKSRVGIIQKKVLGHLQEFSPANETTGVPA